MFRRSRNILGRKPHADPVQVTIDYHDRTKHHPGRSAAALGFMDWDTQPDPFRTFKGAPRVQLALRDPAEGPTYQAALLEGQVEPAPLTHTMISQLFQDSLGLSAWKEFDKKTRNGFNPVTETENIVELPIKMER